MISITMQFQDLDELQAFLASKGDVPLANIAAPAPKKKAAPKKPELVEPPQTTAPVVDLVALRATLGKELIAKNESFNDGNVKIVAFIKTFNVNRLSELPDDQLVAFGEALGALV